MDMAVESLRREHAALLAEAGGLAKRLSGAMPLELMRLLAEVEAFRGRAMAHMRTEDVNFYEPVYRMSDSPLHGAMEGINRDAFFIDRFLDEFRRNWPVGCVMEDWDGYVAALLHVLSLLQYRIEAEERIFRLMEEKGITLAGVGEKIANQA